METTSVFPGGVYDESLQTGRIVADVVIGVDGIEARPMQGEVIRIPFAVLQLETGGTGGNVVFCHDDTRKTTIFTADEGFLRTLATGLHTETADRAQALLSRARAKRWSGRGVWWTIFGAIAVLLVFLPSIFGWLVERTVRALPISVDQELGDLAFEQMDGTLSRVDSTVVAEAMRVILLRLEEQLPEDESRWNFRVMVVRDDSINAFALPGGQMVFHSGLLVRAGSADEVAGVMAHEMAHVLKRHSVQRVAQSLGIVAGVGLIFGDTGVLVAAVAEYLTIAAINKYSRDHESEADAVSVTMMHNAGLDPEALSRMFERMAKEGVQLPDLLHWISTHPTHEARIDAIAAQIEKLPVVEPRPLAIDWEAVRRELAK